MLTSIARITRRFFPNPELRDSVESLVIAPPSIHQFDDSGASISIPLLNSFDYWELLPVATTVTAVSDKLTLLLGTNTPLAAQSTTGGLSLTTGATATNQAGVGGIAATGFAAPVTATNGLFFRTRIQIASLATNWSSYGLSQTTTAAGLLPAVAAIDSVQFLADPTNALTATTGATAAQALNWIICTNVAGTCTYNFTGIPIVAGVDITLAIVLNPNLTWSYFLNVPTNGTATFTSATTATANVVLKPIIGVDTTANATANILVRYAQLARLIG